MKTRYRALLSLLSSLLVGCSFISPQREKPVQAFETQWSYSQTDQVNGVVLLIHGLNNKPSVMDAFATGLRQHGFHTLQVTLRGHGEALFSNAPAEDWLSDVRHAYNEARALYPQLPIYNLSYSLGSLVTASLINRDEQITFRKMVFLAPAITPNGRTQLIRLLTWLRFLHFSLPSLAERKYRAHSSTPLSAYAALFSLVDNISTLHHPERLNAIPTQVFIAKKDELLSRSALKSWLQRNGLTHWELSELSPHPANSLSYNHLILDRGSLGEAEWNRLTGVIVEFFLAQ